MGRSISIRKPVLGSSQTDCYRQWKTLQQQSNTIGDVIGFSKEQKKCAFYDKHDVEGVCAHFLEVDEEWTIASKSKPTAQ